MELSATSGWTNAPVSWTTGIGGSRSSAFVIALTARDHASPKTSSALPAGSTPAQASHTGVHQLADTASCIRSPIEEGASWQR